MPETQEQQKYSIIIFESGFESETKTKFEWRFDFESLEGPGPSVDRICPDWKSEAVDLGCTISNIQLLSSVQTLTSTLYSWT